MSESKAVPCECGYCPTGDHFWDDEEDEKAMLTCSAGGLANHTMFPAYGDLPGEVDDAYHRPRTEPWFLVAEVKSVNAVFRYVADTVTRFGESVRIAFYPDNNAQPRTFQYLDILPGCTMLVSNARQHFFLDGSVGLRIEDLDTVYVFPVPSQTLLAESRKLLRLSRTSCFGCEGSPEKTSKCSKCRLARYCGVECQAAHWKQSHKQLCSQFPKLNELTQLTINTANPRPAFSFLPRAGPKKKNKGSQGDATKQPAKR